jgi:redox-sensing transcriptional repressor
LQYNFYKIPSVTKERLLHLLRILEQSSQANVTSVQIEALTGWSSYTIRKDISYLGGDYGTSAGYNPAVLAAAIKKALGFDRHRLFCVVGLGRLGSAYLNFAATELEEFELAAGFDINVNRVEILQSPVPLYPVYKIAEVVKNLSIEIALLCVPADAAQTTAEKLAAAGIRGIVNFAPVPLHLSQEIVVQNVFLLDGLRSLSIKLNR